MKTQCGFCEAWIGKCQEPTENGEQCARHRGQKCASCGAPATGNCAETMGLVCGAPLCSGCEHTIQSNGCSSGGELPEGMGGHCKKGAQVFKVWCEDDAKEHNRLAATKINVK